jgi:hypothetical protein
LLPDPEVEGQIKLAREIVHAHSVSSMAPDLHSYLVLLAELPLPDESQQDPATDPAGLEPIRVEDLARIAVRPGDVFVWRLPAGQAVSVQEAHRYRDTWRARVPGTDLVILDAGEMFHIRPETEIAEVDSAGNRTHAYPCDADDCPICRQIRKQ